MGLLYKLFGFPPTTLTELADYKTRGGFGVKTHSVSCATDPFNKNYQNVSAAYTLERNHGLRRTVTVRINSRISAQHDLTSLLSELDLASAK